MVYSSTRTAAESDVCNLYILQCYYVQSDRCIWSATQYSFFQFFFLSFPLFEVIILWQMFGKKMKKSLTFFKFLNINTTPLDLQSGIPERPEQNIYLSILFCDIKWQLTTACIPTTFTYLKHLKFRYFYFSLPRNKKWKKPKTKN